VSNWVHGLIEQVQLRFICDGTWMISEALHRPQARWKQEREGLGPTQHARGSSRFVPDRPLRNVRSGNSSAFDSTASLPTSWWGIITISKSRVEAQPESNTQWLNLSFSAWHNRLLHRRSPAFSGAFQSRLARFFPAWASWSGRQPWPNILSGRRIVLRR
jgi:hypothetical protein